MTRHALDATTGAVLGALALATVALLAGCTLSEAIRTADTVRASGHVLAAVVQEVCTGPAEEADDAGLSADEARAVADELEARHCPEAWAAQQVLADAHGALVALLDARRAGQCEPLLAAQPAPRCDLVRVTVRLIEAQARLARAVDTLRGAP